ncbi:hypothetical protein VKA52_15585 [Halobacillus sp. HZG1]|uniref:hypothetical protein n=1 Tax=Halobacillus sp. HZG1 TaxID=3111769 RepID=UPI002DBEF118|nr:hypothetical protein [Halobacillus sp. HZG1]MEC3885155.1 hypothetical protein [Halobacillus sp. HZG1]
MVKLHTEHIISVNILNIISQKCFIDNCKFLHAHPLEYKYKSFFQLGVESENIIIRIDKPFMYRGNNLLFKVYKIIESQNLLYDYVANGLDNISIGFNPIQLSNIKQEELINKINKEIKPSQICTTKNIVSLKFTFNNKKHYSAGLKDCLEILKKAEVVIEVMIQNIQARNFIICFSTSHLKNILKILHK